jgi:lipopolysaccharide transport system permease protein
MTTSNESVRYTAKSELGKPWRLLKDMIFDLRGSRFIAYRLFQRDIKAKYRQALLGYFWAFVPSILIAFGLVAASRANVISIGETNLPYPAYVMLSMVLWQTFVEALNAPLMSVTESKSMLAKIKFPRESIVLAKVLEVFFNFLVKLILVVLLYFFYEMPITWKAAFAFVGVLQLVLLGTFLGLLIAPLGVIYQDISRAVSVGTMVLFLITPVVYPEPKAGIFATIVSMNPVTPLLVATRDLATTGILSNLGPALAVSTVSIVGLLVTWVIFRLSIPYVIERMPS